MSTSIETVWHDFADRLGGFIRQRVGDAAAAEDIRQDVFVKMQNRLGQLRDFTKVESWLYQIARNAIADHFRARRPTTELPETLAAETSEQEPCLDGLTSALRRMVDELPQPYREAIMLAELDGLTQQAIAMSLGISLSGAKSRVQRGRALLKKMIGDCCSIALDHRGGVMDCEPRNGKACQECG
jgi:RNA polymerase sigma-70 factor (ECF subfamily)